MTDLAGQIAEDVAAARARWEQHKGQLDATWRIYRGENLMGELGRATGAQQVAAWRKAKGEPVKDEVPIGRMLFERTVAVVGVALGMWLYRLWVGH